MDNIKEYTSNILWQSGFHSKESHGSYSAAKTTIKETFNREVSSYGTPKMGWICTVFENGKFEVSEALSPVEVFPDRLTMKGFETVNENLTLEDFYENVKSKKKESAKKKDDEQFANIIDGLIDMGISTCTIDLGRFKERINSLKD
jgi:hypothetical protein